MRSKARRELAFNNEAGILAQIICAKDACFLYKQSLRKVAIPELIWFRRLLICSAEVVKLSAAGAFHQ